MTSLALLMLLSAKQVSLASPGWSSPNVERKRVTFFADHLAAQLSLAGLRVITQTEVVQSLALERQKQLLGCSTQSCLSEITDALGVDGLITGTVAKVGKRLALTLKIVASNSGRVLALYDSTVDSEAELVDLLTAQAPHLAEEVRVAVQGKPPPAPGARRLWWLPTALGGAALVAGSTLTGLSWSRYAALNAKDTATVGSDPVAYAGTGQTFQVAGLITASVGVAALLSGLLIFALAPTDPPALSLSVGPGGASLFVRW
jgi:TolB-like protein